MQRLEITSVKSGQLAYYRHLTDPLSRHVGHLPHQAVESYADMGRLRYGSVNGEPVGLILAHQLRSHPEVTAVMQAAVQTSDRLRTFALQMVRHIEQDALARGSRVVRCWVREGIEANDFWRAAGYTVVGRRPPGARRREVLCYARHLTLDMSADPLATSRQSRAWVGEQQQLSLWPTTANPSAMNAIRR